MKNLCLIVVLVISYTQMFSQESSKLKLSTRDSLRLTIGKLNWSVWRTDYYICTGIAYTKSLGRTPEDFGVFVGNEHASSWNGVTGKDFSPVIDGMRFFWSTYKNAHFEILKESDSALIIRSNRPYLAFFKQGPILGVTIEEYDRFFWKHVQVMMDKVGFTFTASIEPDWIDWHFSKRK